MKIDTQKFFSSFEKLIRTKECKLRGVIALAVSGGADSMCLAYLVKEWQKTVSSGIKIICLLVDHKLRAESSREASQVKERLIEQGLQTVVLRWDGIKPKSNIHSIARKARYQLLTDYCKQHGIYTIATAHNKNDQAETVLMRILRGTGIDGLSGIPEINNINGVKVIRPMLSYFRSDIEETLNLAEWKWVVDSSNFNPKYERTKVRSMLKNLENYNPLVYSRLNLLASNAKRTKIFLNNYTHQTYYNITEEGRLGEVLMNKEQFISLDAEIAFRVLVKALNKVSGHNYSPRLNSLELLYQLILTSSNFKKTLWGCEIVCKAQSILFYRELKYVEQRKMMQPNIPCEWDGRYIIAVAEDNLYIGALGIEGLKILKNKTKIKDGNAKILYTTPAIFRDGEFLFHPILTVGYKPNILHFKPKLLDS